MVSQTMNLGGTASDISVAPVSHGLMKMTWTPSPVSDSQCFEAIKAGVDALPAGAKMFLNSGEFYAMDMGTGNLEMLSRFYAKYPEYADKRFYLSREESKTTVRIVQNLRASVDKIQKALGTVKKMDLFEPARIDRGIPIEKIMQSLVILLNEGKFSYIGLSECNADTLRKAHAVYPVTAAEIEINPWAYEVNQRNVISTATELGITVLAYSPLGNGFLTNQIKSPTNLPQGDSRARPSRSKEGHFEHNLAIVDALKAVAEKKGVTPVQLCLAWVSSRGPTVIPLPGSSKSTRTLENLASGDIKLSPEELREIDDMISSEDKGDGYVGMSGGQMYRWG